MVAGIRTTADNADQGWDDYAERVLRNEERLRGVQESVDERIETDRKLAEQRALSLSDELQRRADEVERLTLERREADRHEFRTALAAHQRHLETLALVYDEKHEAEIYRREAALAALESLVKGWRETDREARIIQVQEVARRLEVLNHAHERQEQFQNRAVTRELFQSEKDAQANRETVLRDQIIGLDRAILGLVPQSRADSMKEETNKRWETALAASEKNLANQIDVMAGKVSDLKEYVDKAEGRSGGYNGLYAVIASGMGIILAVVIIVNILTSK